jgi:hypothetical protein
VKKLIKYTFLLAFIFGGWALAAASLHVVRAPGKMFHDYVPVKIQLVTKNNLTFKDTWVDTTKWSAADVANHPNVVERLNQANRMDLLKQAMTTPAPADVTTASAAPTPAKTLEPTPAGPPRQSSIFDFGQNNTK